MWGLIAGIAGSALGSVMASDSARRERKRQEAYYDRKEKQENDEYSRYSNMDWTQSAAAQNTLRKGSKQFKEAIAGARARKALGMGDDHEIDQMISGANEAMGNAIADITEQGEARAEQMRAQHKATLNQIDAARNNMQAQAAQAKIDSWNQVSNIGSQIAMNDIQSYLDNGKGMFETAFGKGMFETAFGKGKTIAEAGIGINMPKNFNTRYYTNK